VSAPSPPRLKWGDLAEAVAGAAFPPDGSEVAGRFDPDDPAAVAAVSVVDGAIAAVERRRRVRPNQPDDVPLDPELFDPQTLTDLLEFLRHSRRGMLTAAEMVEEATMWKTLLRAGWPPEAADQIAVAHAVGLLAVVPAPEPEPAAPRPVEPANEIERAMTAVALDERSRPALWRAIYDGDVVLPVVAYELVRPEGANFQFLAAPIGDTPVILGFATEERFDALLPEGSQVSRVLAPGRDLPKFWPAGHWLMINAGYEGHVTLSPWEVAGLPDGGRAELPHPRAVTIAAPDAGDVVGVGDLVAGAVARLDEVERVCWARVRPRTGGEHSRWQDVLVVTASSPAPEAEGAAVQALTAALPPDLFSRAIVVGRQAHLRHPFIEAVVAAGRPVGEG
jgi:hypothetical protein